MLSLFGFLFLPRLGVGKSNLSLLTRKALAGPPAQIGRDLGSDGHLAGKHRKNDQLAPFSLSVFPSYSSCKERVPLRRCKLRFMFFSHRKKQD